MMYTIEWNIRHVEVYYDSDIEEPKIGRNHSSFQIESKNSFPPLECTALWTVGYFRKAVIFFSHQLHVFNESQFIFSFRVSRARHRKDVVLNFSLTDLPKWVMTMKMSI